MLKWAPDSTAVALTGDDVPALETALRASADKAKALGFMLIAGRSWIGQPAPCCCILTSVFAPEGVAPSRPVGTTAIAGARFNLSYMQSVALAHGWDGSPNKHFVKNRPELVPFFNLGTKLREEFKPVDIT
jgi:hypothetical protein